MLTVFYNHVKEAMRQENKSLAEVAKIITEAGISGLEFDYLELMEKGYFDEELATTLRDLGLPITGVYINFDWGHKLFDTSYKKMYKNLKKIGVKYSLAIPGMVKDGDDKEKCMRRMAKRLKKAVDYATKLGIQVLMEDFDYYQAPFATASGMQYFLDNVPGLKIAFDTGNFFYSDEDALAKLPQFINETEYVHCKDRCLEEKAGETPTITVSGKSLYSSAVGDGVIPIKEIVESLINHGYKGVYAIEHFGSQTQLKDMIKSAEYLNSILQN